MTRSPRKALIIGAGIAGPVTAILLKKAGFHAAVYEAWPYSTGIGGGILLAPLMLGLRWSSARQTAAVSAAFNLLNSAAALVGLWISLPSFPFPSPWWLAAVACGGLLGSWLGIRGLTTWALRYALAVLLVVAGGGMLWS